MIMMSLALLLVGLQAACVYGATSSVDIDTLQSIYVATSGDRWLYHCYGFGPCGVPWNFSNPSVNPCDPNTPWYGISCSDQGGIDVVSLLSLPLTGLVGTLPTSIGNFNGISGFDISANSVRGPIPSEFGKLTNLTAIYLESNAFSGEIPSSFGSLQACTLLSVGSNCLTGKIPISLYGISGLVQIDLGYNSLSGSVSSLIGNWANSMMFMDLNSNFFTGSIPSTLTGFSLLRSLVCDMNLFNGSLPSELFVNPSLQVLLLNANYFSGSVPSTISALNPTLTELNLALNSFTGLILPHLLTSESALGSIDLSYNMFSGSLPSTIGNWKSLEYMYLYNNYFTGPLPLQLADMHLTAEMLVQYNFITGPVPNVLVTGNFLQIFNCRSNFISGTIPSNLGYYGNLTSIDATDNQFYGTIPTSVGDLEILALLAVSINRFSGLLPATLSGVTSLVTLLLHQNYFTGTTGPIFTTNFGALEAFDISDNNFHGPMPDLIFHLPAIEVISLTRNCFTGTIPSHVCRATNLRKLSMSGLSSGSNCIRPVFMPVSSGIYASAYMQGSIPSCILQLPNLLALEMSGNALTGDIPPIPPTSRLVNLSLSHNRLKGDIPESFGPHFKFGVMDISFNKVKGTLNALKGFNLSDYNTTTVDRDTYNDDLLNHTEVVSRTTTQIFLEVNRLSGDVPGAFEHALSVDILSGNYFQCAYLGDDTLPTHDPDYKHYSCGSSSLDLALFLNLFVLVLVIVGIVSYTLHQNYVCMLKNNNDTFYKSYCSCLGVLLHTPMLIQIAFWDLFIYVSMLRSKVSLVRDIETLETRSLIMLYMELRHFAVRIALLLGFVVMPIYVIIGVWYSTITFQYGWVVSAGFTAGFVPATVFMVVWSGVLYVVYLSIYHIKQRLGAFHRQNIEHYQSELGQVKLASSPQRNIYAWAHGISAGGTAEGTGTPSRGDCVTDKPPMTGVHRSTDGGVELQTTNPMHTNVASVNKPVVNATSAPSPGPTSGAGIAKASLWQSWCNMLSGCVSYWSFDEVYLYILVPLINGIIVVLFNGMYVWVVITQSTLITLFAQLALVVFKTGWNQFCVPALIAYVRVIRPRCNRAHTSAAGVGVGVTTGTSTETDSGGLLSSAATSSDTGKVVDDDDEYYFLDDDDLFSRATITAAHTNGVLASRYSSRWTFSATLRDTDLSFDGRPSQIDAATPTSGGSSRESSGNSGSSGGGGGSTDPYKSSLPHRMYSKHYRIQVLLLMFNNVIAPYFATAAADANCFLYLFVKPHDITSIYVYPECVYYTDHGCLQFASSDPVVSSYTPPFIYYYQCSTSVITNYIPVFVLVYMYLGLFMPCWHFFNLYLSLKKAQGEIDGDLTGEEREAAENRAKLKTYAAFIGSKKGVGLFKAPNTTCNLVGHIAVLLTFGVVYPPLGVIIALYMVTTTLTWQSLLESLFSVCDFNSPGATAGDGASVCASDTTSGQVTDERTNASADMDAATLTAASPELQPLTDSGVVCYNLELQCFGLYCVLHDSKELLIFGASLFYAAALLDMIGDNTVNEEILHVWVPICMLLVAMLISKNKVKLIRQLGLDTASTRCRALFSSAPPPSKQELAIRSSTFEMTGIERGL